MGLRPGFRLARFRRGAGELNFLRDGAINHFDRRPKRNDFLAFGVAIAPDRDRVRQRTTLLRDPDTELPKTSTRCSAGLLKHYYCNNKSSPKGFYYL